MRCQVSSFIATLEYTLPHHLDRRLTWSVGLNHAFSILELRGMGAGDMPPRDPRAAEVLLGKALDGHAFPRLSRRLLEWLGVSVVARSLSLQ
jgi:hypothetical protein